MKKILLDASNLAHQAAHVFSGDAGADAAIVYGLLCRVLYLGLEFKTNKVCCCFDAPPYARRKLSPTYKQNRAMKKRTPDERAWLDNLFEQLDTFRELIAGLGLASHRVVGLEADDLIAINIMSQRPDDQWIIASRDHDLYQLLADNVVISKKHDQRYTAEDFREEWFGASPNKWPTIKAIAGDDGDNVPGLKGVGLPTAAKYVQGMLRPGKIRDRIDCFVEGGQFALNLQLVRLPWHDTLVLKDVGKVPGPPDDFMDRLEGLALAFGFDSFMKEPMLSKWKSFASDNPGDAAGYVEHHKQVRSRAADLIKRRIRR